METLADYIARRDADFALIRNKLCEEVRSHGYDLQRLDGMLETLNEALSTPLPPFKRNVKVCITVEVPAMYYATHEYETFTPEDVYDSTIDYNLNFDEMGGDVFDNPADYLCNSLEVTNVEFLNYND